MQLDDVSSLDNQVQIQCEYPGQNMMIALAIMLNYDNLEVAEKGDGGEVCPAISSMRIPGSGGSVNSTLDALRNAVTDDLDSAAVIENLNDRWRREAGHQYAYKNRVQKGLDKAKPFEEIFAHYWANWNT